MSCSGACVGYSTKTHVVRGKCPRDCSTTILNRLQAEAEKEAREKANDGCFGDDCVCEGESTEIITPGCEEHNLGEPCGEVCVYHVTVIYRGVCKPKAR
jgi:hypothetical protein